MVRVKDGDLVSTNGVTRKVSSSFGYSVQIKFKSLVEEGSRIKVQTAVLLSPYDLGRRSARGTVSKLDRFIEGKTKVPYLLTFFLVMICIFFFPGTRSKSGGELDRVRDSGNHWRISFFSVFLYFRSILRSCSETNEEK
jgi:hypothetical protein